MDGFADADQVTVAGHSIVESPARETTGGVSLRSYAEFHVLLAGDSARINLGVTISSRKAIPLVGKFSLGTTRDYPSED